MATETLRPNAAGDSTDFTSQVPASGSHWDKVDEASADDDTTYIRADPNGGAFSGRDLFNLPAPSSSGQINSVTMYIRAITNIWGDCRGQLRTYSINYSFPGAAWRPAAWTTINNTWITNPNTGNPWTWQEIEDLQIGASGFAGAGQWVQVTQAYIVIDYTPGWSSGDVSGVPVSQAAKINGVALASIVRVNGV